MGLVTGLVALGLAGVAPEPDVAEPGGHEFFDAGQVTPPAGDAGPVKPDNGEPDDAEPSGPDDVLQPGNGEPSKPDGASPGDAGPTTPDDGEPDEPADGTEPTGEPEPPPSAAPPMPAIEELPSRDPEAAPSHHGTAPPKPVVENLPSRQPKPRRFALSTPDPDRPPAGAHGGSFFDPAKLEEGSPGGGALQIRGFVSANFLVAMRTNMRQRNAAGHFERLKPAPFFDVNSAALYFGAPIYSDVVYARMSFEFLSIPTLLVNSSAQADIIPQAKRFMYFESAAIEINPLSFAKKAPDWIRHAFKLTGGVFIVPFGIEDEEHASPVNWFITRPRSMTSNRVYPGTWADVGMVLKWKPRFVTNKPIRPIEIDVGVINGDPCSQTRFVDTLYRPGLNITCSRPRRPGEISGSAAFDPTQVPRIDSGFFGIASDNNLGKSVVARVQAYPLPAINFGGSLVYGTHPDATRLPDPGKTTADLGQAPSYRVGGHLAVDFDKIVASKYPLPALRGEVVYGVDSAIDHVTTDDRRMLGGYLQVAQPLFRRKKSRLPGLILQYRFDQADPDLAVPGVVRGVVLRSDFSDQFFADETLQSHTIGLRLPALPRFTIKTEYTFVLEDGGRANALYNDLWGIQMVADF